ncbi:flippase [Haloarchaeobius litoreus]|uniref:Flippase n=1 Tax=Haloarchaeobius litoreus TaxID=755306 RepID=A0ABD6DKY7_9EURY|nr:flippase [Haloarchaeobius litoreus]
MRIGQTSIIYSVSRFAGSALGFVATVYFARVLGDAVLGQFALILALVMWVGIASQVGLSESITKRISEGSESEKYFGAGLVFAGGVTVVATLVILLFGDTVDSYVGTSAVLFVIPLLALITFKSILNAALHGRRLVHLESLLQIGGQAVKSAVQIALVAVGWGIGGMVTGYAVSSLLTGIVALWVIDIRPAAPRREHFVSLFKFAKYSWLGNLSQRFYGNLDVTVLGVFVASGLVGVYSVVWSIVVFLTIFGNGIQTTIFPEMSKQSTDGNREAVVGLTEDALMYSGLVLIPGFVGAIIVGDRVLRIYGPTFTRGTEVFAILVMAAIIWTFNKQLVNAFNAIDRPDIAFRSNSVFVVANTILNVVLIYQFDIVGAAVATMLSSGIALLMSARYARSWFDIDPPLGEIARQCLSALLMGGVVLGARTVLSSYFSGYNLVFVVVLVSIGAGVYFAVLTAISRDFRTTLSRNLPSNTITG